MKKLGVFCLLLKITITTILIEFYLFGKLLIGPGIVLGYLFFLSLPTHLNTRPLDARGDGASIQIA